YVTVVDANGKETTKKIGHIKGDKGDKGSDGNDGKNGESVKNHSMFDICVFLLSRQVGDGMDTRKKILDFKGDNGD
ncbi:hypothetical protein, partial [Lactobacillus iners]|uniref:hypothetical protein n=1 Tax=Lactobacillus iners TaxID=147802 RepID=UPI0039A73470